MKAFRFLLFLFFAIIPAAGQQTKPLDPANMDLTVRPCDNFYSYANGTWLKNTPIPSEFSSWGSFTELAEKNNEVLKEILETAAKDMRAPKGSNIQKVGDFYATGMDSAAIEALGFTPIRDDLRRIDAIASTGDLQAELARLHASGVGGVFGFSSGIDAKNSAQVIGQISQGGLGLPDREFYFEQDQKSKDIRQEYVGHIAAMFRLIGLDKEAAQEDATTVMAFETRLAKASRTRVERRDPDKNYNKMTQQQLVELSPHFGWARFFEAVGSPDPGDINVGQPEFLKEVDLMLTEVPLNDWKVYLRWRVLRNAAPALSSAFVQENFRFYGTILTGAKEIQPRWKRIRAVINNLLGEALGEMYVARAFPPEAKAKALEMVNNLKDAMREHIRKLDWMDDSTKAAALKKLNSFGVKIGYPDKWRDYSGLPIDRSSYFENLRRASEFNTAHNLGKIGKPVDKTEWGMTPPTVNAYYSATRNEIVFPAGILQPPFFDFKADDAVNYGGMGAVIGHEISHGFDDQGSKFDADGNLRMWWTAETRKRFEERTAVLGAQFDGYTVLDSLRVNGKLTMGENIGDLGGLALAYTALMNSLKGKSVGPIDGFTPQQRFFLSWAQVWRRNVRPEQLRLQVKTDTHSPAEFRTNGPVVNLQEWYDAFGCGPDGAMYVPVDKRAKIWNWR
ncbi:MAG: peptidase M13 [Bacteroidia bacterium]|nr:MAG: peptidase M13 [Bacteroidia bacterium]